MTRLISIFIWISIALSIVALSHYYIWMRFVRDVALPSPLRHYATFVIVLLGASIPLSMILGRLINDSLSRAVMWATYTWMGIFFIAIVVLAASDLLRGAWYLWTLLGLHGESVADSERRLFLQRLLGGALGAVTLGIGGYGLRRVIQGPQWIETEIRLKRLPKSFDGCSIVQISDLHASHTLRRDYVERVVSMTMDAQPDLIALTGDFVDGSVEDLRDIVAPLAQMRAPLGVYFVTGNHEYYSGVDEWLAEFRRLGIRVLRNERVDIHNGKEFFDLVGIDDWTAHQFGNGHGADLRRAVAGRDTVRELILLAHQPKAVFEAEEHGVGLQLSGHTHQGQIWPFEYLVRLAQPFIAGLGRQGETQIYVNRGTGYWGPPLRVGTRSEISRLILRCA